MRNMYVAKIGNLSNPLPPKKCLVSIILDLILQTFYELVMTSLLIKFPCSHKVVKFMVVCLKYFVF